MAIKTTLEQLEEVQTAISAVLLGQEVTVNGKRWTGADLNALEKREQSLLKRYYAENGVGGLTTNNVIRRRD